MSLVLDEDELDDGGVLGVMELLLELDEGVDAVPELDVPVAEDDDEGLVVDGVVLLELLDEGGDIVDELELDDGGVVVEGVDVVDDVLLVSRWQPAAPIATATARMAQGFRFM